MLAGRYRLARSLGEGGMGQVWEAHDHALWRPVAVKLISVLAGAGSRADEARARFLREARITAALQHPNIVTVYDLGQAATAEGTTPFLVMELLRGEGLDSILDRGPVSLAHAASWGEQIAAALAHAHLAGVLHRDIKPGNILITATGTVKVLDFGIARAADPSAAGDLLTQTGIMVGTPPYMAPEQARGRPEANSDLYALGCLLFEMITGRRPFNAPDTVGYLSAHLTEAPPAPSSVATGIPAEWDQLILRLLQKDPAQRYGSAAELAAALAQLAHDPVVPVPLGAPDLSDRQPDPGAPAGGPTTLGTEASLAAPSIAAPATDGAGGLASTQAPPARAKRRSARVGLLVVFAISLVLAGRWYGVSLESSTPSTRETPAERTQDNDSEGDTTPSPPDRDGDNDTDGEGGKGDRDEKSDKGNKDDTGDEETDQSPEDVPEPPADNKPQLPPAEEANPPAERQPDPPTEQEPDQPAAEDPNPPAEDPATDDPGDPGREHCNYYSDRTEEVSRGDEGNAVREIECLLNYNYGYNLNVDGEFGENTEAAVKEVEECSGLNGDGVVGTNTWAVLDDPKPRCVP